MKKLKVLFLSLVAVLSISSCSNDDDNSQTTGSTGLTTSGSIVGKWELSQEGETLTTLEPVENEGSCGSDLVEIKTGGTFKSTGFDYYDAICHPYTGEGTWVKTNNTLTIKEGDDTIVFEIIELSSSTMKLKETDPEGIWFSVFTRK